MNIFKIAIGLFYLHNIEKRFMNLEQAKKYIFNDINKYAGLSVVISEYENVNDDEPLHAWCILNKDNDPQKYFLLNNNEIFSENEYNILCLEHPHIKHPIHQTIYIDNNKSYELDFIEKDNGILNYINNGIKTNWIIG